MSPSSDPDPYPPVLKIRRRAPPAQWVRIEHYPNLPLERIRGVDVYRTKTEWALRYRIVISVHLQGTYRIPAVIAIPNEARIRFGDYPIEWGFLDEETRRVHEWFEPTAYTNKDVILSNPDYVRHRHPRPNP